MHRDGARAALVVLVAKDALVELARGKDRAVRLEQDPQQGELRRREGERTLVERGLVGRHVEHEAAARDDTVLLAMRPTSCVVRGIAPELRLHARHELERQEWLHHVVVRAQGEAGNLVRLLAAGREHDHRVAVAPADGPAGLEAARAGQHDVEDREVERRRIVVRHARDRRRSVAERLNLEALRLEVDAHELADLRLVVHHQHACAHAPLPSYRPQGYARRTQQFLTFA